MFAAACAAPSNYEVAPVALAAAPVAVAAAPAVSVPAPYTTTHVAGAPSETVVQPPAVVRKQLHFGQTPFVSGYAAAIHKPPTPRLPIAVPTALKGTVATNAPIVSVVKEPHVVNEPYPVEKRVQVPYDVPVLKEQIVEVPVPVHVDKPYGVPHPVPVQGAPIVNVRRGPALVQRTHTAIQAQPIIKHTAIAAAPLAAAPLAAAPLAAAPLAAAPLAAAPLAAAPLAAPLAAAPLAAAPGYGIAPLAPGYGIAPETVAIAAE